MRRIASENRSEDINKPPTVGTMDADLERKIINFEKNFFILYPLTSIGCHDLEDFVKVKTVYT